MEKKKDPLDWVYNNHELMVRDSFIDKVAYCFRFTFKHMCT